MNKEDYSEKRYSVSELIDVIKKNSLLIYSIVFFISISVKTIYYRAYSINIFAYFDVLDYTLSFLADNLDFFIAFFLYLVIGYISIRIVESLKFIFKIHNKPSSLNVLFFIISFGTCLFVINQYYFSKFAWLGFIGSYLLMQSYFRTYGLINKSFGIVKMDIYNTVITSIVSFIIFSAINNYSPSSLKANIMTEKNNYYVDSVNLIFVGESKNYLFLYNKSKSESFFLKRDDIQEMKYFSLQ
jgi:hypothetical protein